jgi:hypothetical protein
MGFLNPPFLKGAGGIFFSRFGQVHNPYAPLATPHNYLYGGNLVKGWTSREKVCPGIALSASHDYFLKKSAR